MISNSAGDCGTRCDDSRARSISPCARRWGPHRPRPCSPTVSLHGAEDVHPRGALRRAPIAHGVAERAEARWRAANPLLDGLRARRAPRWPAARRVGSLPQRGRRLVAKVRFKLPRSGRHGAPPPCLLHTEGLCGVPLSWFAAKRTSAMRPIRPVSCSLMCPHTTVLNPVYGCCGWLISWLTFRVGTTFIPNVLAGAREGNQPTVHGGAVRHCREFHPSGFEFDRCAPASPAISAISPAFGRCSTVVIPFAMLLIISCRACRSSPSVRRQSHPDAHRPRLHP